MKFTVPRGPIDIFTMKITKVTKKEKTLYSMDGCEKALSHMAVDELPAVLRALRGPSGIPLLRTRRWLENVNFTSVRVLKADRCSV